jgi:hypothetical protein
LTDLDVIVEAVPIPPAFATVSSARQDGFIFSGREGRMWRKSFVCKGSDFLKMGSFGNFRNFFDGKNRKKPEKPSLLRQSYGRHGWPLTRLDLA